MRREVLSVQLSPTYRVFRQRVRNPFIVNEKRILRYRLFTPMIGHNTTRVRIAAFVVVLVVVIAIGAAWYVEVRRHRADVLAMRSVFDQYTLDLGRTPRSLDNLVKAGYVKRGAETDKHFQEVFGEAAGRESSGRKLR